MNYIYRDYSYFLGNSLNTFSGSIFCEIQDHAEDEDNNESHFIEGENDFHNGKSVAWNKFSIKNVDDVCICNAFSNIIYIY